jgi:hypothetical protein
VFKSDGFTVADLKKLGFNADDLLRANCQSAQNCEIVSEYHREVMELMEERVRSGRSFGQTWSEFHGFSAPYGTTRTAFGSG